MRLLILSSLLTLSTALPQSVTNQCGTNERGLARQAGDSWMEDCNRCRCSDKLLPGCTKRFCPPTSEDSKEPQGTSNRNNAGGGGGGVVNFPGAVRATRDEGVCVDSAGVTRVPGESWKEQCNTCQCDSDGNALCTEIFCNNDDDAVEVCTDSQGKPRIPGESWKEDCNTCRCASTGVALCSQRFCVNIQPRDFYLFTEDPSKDKSSIPQCNQEGVENCRAVTINNNLLTSKVPSQQFIKLIQGTDIELQLKGSPTSGSSPGRQSYRFSLTDGGEASMTVNSKTGGVYGTVRPLTGDYHYTLEAAFGGGSVLFQRDKNYFNQFED